MSSGSVSVSCQLVIICKTIEYIKKQMNTVLSPFEQILLTQCDIIADRKKSFEKEQIRRNQISWIINHN